MSSGMYIAMSAAIANSKQLDVIANNLANVNTPGFKAGQGVFSSLLPEEGGGDHIFVIQDSHHIDKKAGTAVETGNYLDVFVEENLFLGVSMPDGSAGYTRDGRLQVGPDGRLYAQGLPILGEGGSEITVPAGTKPIIKTDGRITVPNTSTNNQAEPEQEIGRLALFRLDGPMKNAASALFLPVEDTQAQEQAGKVRVGQVEQSNANALESTIALIRAERSFDQAMQAMQTYKQMGEKGSEIGRLRG